jgi:hypothetical protein
MRHLTRSERGSFGVQIKGPDEIKKGPPVLCSQAGCEMLMGHYGIGELTKGALLAEPEDISGERGTARRERTVNVRGKAQVG